MAERNISAFRAVIIMGLIAGTLDISAAIIILAKMRAAFVLRYVASGVFGKEAYTAGPHMIAFGLFFHYLIAMTIATIYFLMFPHLSFLKTNRILNAVLIGLCAWLFMSLVVVPLSQIGPLKMTPEGAIKNIVILIVCIGLPVSLLTSKYYKQIVENSLQ
ncbi:MAG: DUF1440 domain-containing protein [Saprospiraceae bacterium]